MIRINLQSADVLNINRAIANAVNALRNRSFADRHQELGKMRNCPICSLRHREPFCVPVYAKFPEDHPQAGQERILPMTTRKQVYGAAAFAKKRFLSHHSHRLLQLVQMTQKLFEVHSRYLSDPTEAMKAARTEAGRLLKASRRSVAKAARMQQQLSRRINSQSLTGNAVLRFNNGTAPKRETVIQRREAQLEREKANAL